MWPKISEDWYDVHRFRSWIKKKPNDSVFYEKRKLSSKHLAKFISIKHISLLRYCDKKNSEKSLQIETWHEFKSWLCIIVNVWDTIRIILRAAPKVWREFVKFHFFIRFMTSCSIRFFLCFVNEYSFSNRHG